MEEGIKTQSKIPSEIAIKIEPFDVRKRYTRPHRHDKYLELVYFSGGTGKHFMDGKAYAIDPPVVFVIRKDEVHHWEIDSEPEGYVIIVKEAFLDQTLDKQINYLFSQIANFRTIALGSDATIGLLFETASREVDAETRGSAMILEGILKALLAKFLDNIPKEGLYAMQDIGSAFSELLQKGPVNDVAHYASLLHTTAQNLNAHCKKRWDKTASEVIASYLIAEAKRLLHFTDLTVAEVAHRLAFRDPSHFVKYFKRHVGQTPFRYKREIRNHVP